MKGIKWPQIKGNLGSKAYIYVGVSWFCQLVWDSPLFTGDKYTR